MGRSAISVLAYYKKNEAMHWNSLLCSQMMTANCDAVLQRYKSAYTKSETDDQNKSQNKHLRHKPQKYDTLLVLYHKKLNMFNPVNYWLTIR